jgi:hypothetical protein
LPTYVGKLTVIEEFELLNLVRFPGCDGGGAQRRSKALDISPSPPSGFLADTLTVMLLCASIAEDVLQLKLNGESDVGREVVLKVNLGVVSEVPIS